MFMEQNLRLRQQQAEDTTQFLGAQLEEAKTKLDEQDAKLADFQGRFVGELPENEQNNLTLLMGLSPQLEAATQAVNQAREERAFVESMLSQQLAAWELSGKGPNPETLEQQLAKEQIGRASCRERGKISGGAVEIKKISGQAKVWNTTLHVRRN